MSHIHRIRPTPASGTNNSFMVVSLRPRRAIPWSPGRTASVMAVSRVATGASAATRHARAARRDATARRVSMTRPGSPRSFHATPRTGSTAKCPTLSVRTRREKSVEDRPVYTAHAIDASSAEPRNRCSGTNARNSSGTVRSNAAQRVATRETMTKLFQRHPFAWSCAAIRRGGLLPEAAHREHGRRIPPARFRSARLDPAVRGLRPVRLDAQEHDATRSGGDRDEGRVDVGHEAVIVSHVVVRREERHGGLGRDEPKPLQGVKNRRRRPPVLGLHDEGARPELPHERRVVLLMRSSHDDQGLVGTHRALDPPAGLVEKGRPVQDPTELFGPIVAGELARECSEPGAISAGEDPRPPDFDGLAPDRSRRRFLRAQPSRAEASHPLHLLIRGSP